MRRSSLATALAVLAPLGLAPVPALAAGPGGHLEITEVAVDAAAETITISGRDLDFGGPLAVELGELGDVTPLCSASFAPPPQTIVCDFSATGLPPAGDYLLTVATGGGQSQSDEYDLTIAAAAPGPPPTLAFYRRSATDSAAGGGVVEVITATALCDAGDVVTGGGIRLDIGPGPHSMIQDLTSAPNAGGTGWVGRVERIMDAGSTLEVWAICADVAL